MSHEAIYETAALRAAVELSRQVVGLWADVACLKEKLRLAEQKIVELEMTLNFYENP